MDKIKLLNSIYMITNSEEQFLSPSDIVINCFDEFMILTDYIHNENVDKIYIKNLEYGKCVMFAIPGNVLRESTILGTPTLVDYAQKQFMIVSDIIDGHSIITITRVR